MLQTGCGAVKFGLREHKNLPGGLPSLVRSEASSSSSVAYSSRAPVFCDGRQPWNNRQLGDTRVSTSARPTGNMDERKGRELYVSGIMASTISMNVRLLGEAEGEALTFNGSYESVNISTHFRVYVLGKSTRTV